MTSYIVTRALEKKKREEKEKKKEKRKVHLSRATWSQSNFGFPRVTRPSVFF